MYTSTAPLVFLAPSANAAPSHHPRLQISCPPSPHFVSPVAALFLPSYTSGCSSTPSAAALAPLPTAHFVALRLLFYAQQVQGVQFLPLKPAPFCKLSAGIGSTKSQLHLFPSPPLTRVLSPFCPLLHLFFFLKLSSISGRNCMFSPLLSGYNGFTDTHFIREPPG